MSKRSETSRMWKEIAELVKLFEEATKDIPEKERRARLDALVGKRAIYRATFRGYAVDYTGKEKLLFHPVMDATSEPVLGYALFSRSDQWEALDLRVGDVVQFKATMKPFLPEERVRFAASSDAPYRLFRPTGITVTKMVVTLVQRETLPYPSKEERVARLRDVADERYAELQLSIRRAILLLSSLPDDVLDALLRTTVEADILGGVTRNTRKNVDAAVGEAIRAVSRIWEHRYGDEHLAGSGLPQSMDALMELTRVLELFSPKRIPEDRMAALLERDDVSEGD
jgi:hypothetical protein